MYSLCSFYPPDWWLKDFIGFRAITPSRYPPHRWLKEIGLELDLSLKSYPSNWWLKERIENRF